MAKRLGFEVFGVKLRFGLGLGWAKASRGQERTQSSYFVRIAARNAIVQESLKGNFSGISNQKYVYMGPVQISVQHLIN